ncbi:hypothetical protein NXS19_002429 [Fusarium pseudograminearum]|nr:hypothetical protein NXS19_002429 [Fusarium pseudograminearum]
MDRARKRELRTLNEKAWDGESDVFPVGKTLDSSLKKNTAFIKRLRTAVTAATLSTFLQEIRTLSLHKYLSEIISPAMKAFVDSSHPAKSRPVSRSLVRFISDSDPASLRNI